MRVLIIFHDSIKIPLFCVLLRDCVFPSSIARITVVSVRFVTQFAAYVFAGVDCCVWLDSRRISTRHVRLSAHMGKT